MWRVLKPEIFSRPNVHCLERWSFQTVRASFSTKSTVASDVEIQIPGRAQGPPLKLTFGKLARFADGSCVASLGSTSVLVTAVSRSSSNASQGFFPLTVDYRQKCSAAGRIPTNHLRREIGTSDREILTSRVIDRSLRPLFPKGYTSETQLVCNLLAVDGNYDPDVVALNAASASLAMSDIPWNGPVGAVRVGKLRNSSDFLINPTRKELLNSELNLIVSGTAEGLTVMLEGEANNLEKSLFLDGIRCGLNSCAAIARQIQEEADRRQIAKRPMANSTISAAVESSIDRDMELFSEQKIRRIYSDTSHDKVSRDKAAFAVRDEAVLALKETYQGVETNIFMESFSKMCRKIVADMVLTDKRRVDGRNLNQLRDISCEVDLHSPLHGSAIFQRGQTQVFCTVALDSLESALKADAVSILMGGVKEKNFFLHYEFPSYAVNEIGRTNSIGRRELGHGALAEKALKPIIPKDFPFTIRLTSEVLESNGSSSMASVCGGSLSLLDAGVPISSPAAGVAVGLVTRPGETSTDYAVLLDILGLEDHLGEMDFKVAGTRTGVTALQADIKIPGLDFNIVSDAMNLGFEGISKILDIMEDCQSEPRSDKSNWPLSEKLNVPMAKRGKFMGPGGSNIKRLMAETGVQVTPHPEDAGTWTIFAPNRDAMEEAKEFIEKILTEERVPEFEFGAIYPATIVEIVDRGVMVQLHPEMQPVLIVNSQLDAKKVSHPSALGLKVGQELMVKYYGRDPVSGSVRLSRKVLTMSAASAVKKLQSSARSGGPQRNLSRFTESVVQISEFYPTTEDADGGKEAVETLEWNVGSQGAPTVGSSRSTRDQITYSFADMSYTVQRKPAKSPFDLKDYEKWKKVSEERYYDVDKHLNALMSTKIEMNEAQERLEIVKRELAETKRKYVFLSETSYSNRILAQSFLDQKYEQYQKLLAQKKAVEESVRNCRNRHRECETALKQSQELFSEAQEQLKCLETERENKIKQKIAVRPVPQCRDYVAIIKAQHRDYLEVNIPDLKRVETIPKMWVKTTSGLCENLKEGNQVNVRYVGLDPVLHRDIFIVAPKEENSLRREPSKFSHLLNRDTWKDSN